MHYYSLAKKLRWLLLVPLIVALFFLVMGAANSHPPTKGTVSDKGSVGGGYFIAAKQSGEWIVVHDGQTNPTCDKIAPYNFPKDMVPECLDGNGNVVKR